MYLKKTQLNFLEYIYKNLDNEINLQPKNIAQEFGISTQSTLLRIARLRKKGILNHKISINKQFLDKINYKF
jgi:Mn-dependent DtxR family transcriptional regulator